jgi:hypothetical protein
VPKVLSMTTLFAFVFTSSLWAADATGGSGPGEESVTLNFNELGKKFGVTMIAPNDMPSGGPQQNQSSDAEGKTLTKTAGDQPVFDIDDFDHAPIPNSWGGEKGVKLLEYVKQYAKEGQKIIFDGHTECWLSLALVYVLKMCDINSYIPLYDKWVKTTKFTIGNSPNPAQPMTFEVQERGDDVLIIEHIGKGLDLAYSEMVAPKLPAGKNIYVRLKGQHRMLSTYPLSLTYGDEAKAMFVDYAGDCFCCVSHTSGVKVGDRVKCPFP